MFFSSFTQASKINVRLICQNLSETKSLFEMHETKPLFKHKGLQCKLKLVKKNPKVTNEIWWEMVQRQIKHLANSEPNKMVILFDYYYILSQHQGFCSKPYQEHNKTLLKE